MHCNAKFISSVVRSAFTNMNYPIGKNVRLYATKYGIGEGDVGDLVRNFLYSILFMVCHGKFLRGRI